MFPRLTILAGALVALTACQMEPPAPAEPAPDACGAASLQGLVGQPAAVLQTMRFGTETRIIRPGTAVTMDFRDNRLNIEIDKAETIIRVACG